MQPSRFLQALAGERPESTPVWFMRQAGRSLPEYRQLRVGTDMLQACLTPALASEITLQPVRRHQVDAAIFFSDIVVPLELVGCDVSIVPGRGPVFAEPVADGAAVARVTSRNPAELLSRADVITEAMGRTLQGLAEESDRRDEHIPLIGFAGAPFTLAAYLVAGGPSKDHLEARRLMHADPSAWQALLTWVAEVTGAFLALQADAGASAVQLFDSWVGSLSAQDYRDHVRWASARALEQVQQRGVPIIHFGTNTGELLPAIAELPVMAVGVDYRMPLVEAVRRLPRRMPVQGNLDPAMLFAPQQALREAVHQVLQGAMAAPAHIFNLGHGVPPDADPQVLSNVVRWVHEWRPDGV